MKNDTNKKTEENNLSEDKLVTLAIHTYEKAEILKSILENAGIEAILTNVNQLTPIFSAGVRIKIKEKDLLRALDIVEHADWNKDEIYAELNYLDRYRKGAKQYGYVLLPVDFSDFTPKIVTLGFKFAARRGLDVVIQHAYFSQYFAMAPLVMNNVMDYHDRRELNMRREYEQATKKMEDLKTQIDTKIKEGSLPAVSYQTVLRDGHPEDFILSTIKQAPPTIVIMGTRGKSKRNEDLIGSVAAEIVDSAKVPVLVVPEDALIDDLMDVKNVGVATSFDQRDLVLFDRMMHLFKPLSPHYYLFNVTRMEREIGEMELKMMASHHKEHYPDAEIEFARLQEGNFSEAMDDFLTRRRIDLIVINSYRRNIFARFFNPGIARRMLFHTKTPLLVMPSRSLR